MKVFCTEIPDVKLIVPDVHRDARGYFFESFSQKRFCEEVASVQFVQDNESRSTYGVVRGLHFQKGDAAQAKLVRVVSGRILDVIVDIRPGSPAFGKHCSVELTAEGHEQLFIPKGMAHGFAVLSDEAVLQYKCDAYYAPDAEGGIAWDDPDLAIDWKIPPQDVVLSDKDRRHPRLKDLNI